LTFPAVATAQGRKPAPPPPRPNRKQLEDKLKQEAAARALALDALQKQAAEYKKAVSAAQRAAAEGRAFEEVALLSETYLLLAGAAHDYEGHRVRAMKEIEAAVRDLNAAYLKDDSRMGKKMKELEKQTAASAITMAQAGHRDYQDLIASDHKLRAARYWLDLARQSLARNKQTSPLGHVDEAIRQIDAGLKAAEVWHKFLQAEALRRAYILLAWANHDYGGWRHKAMIQVQEAVNLLDADIMRNGDALQKARDYVEKEYVDRVKLLTDEQPDMHEIQRVSDLLLRNAHAWLRLVHYSLTQDKPRAAEHVQLAARDIEIALKKEASNWTRFHEDVALQEAYLLLAAANRDPGNHRAKAMGHIVEAVRILDAALLEADRPLGRAIKRLEAEVAIQANLDEHRLLASELQFRSARDWLVLVKRALAEHEQEALLKHVEQAIHEVNLVLERK
ncbi:MAG TPA: hypothetical protein VFW33_00500, partial [Gemmataceae bacterium]|nr:hypothetical protein [Gemmataceae bacterium]